MLIRVVKRRSSWEEDDPLEIAKVEFGRAAVGEFDLRPSVYQVSSHEAVRVMCEHVASFLSPPRGLHGWDCPNGDALEVAVTEGTTRFMFANARHRELVTPSVDDLLGLIRRVLAVRDERRVELTKVQVRSYVVGRMSAGDPEWHSIMEEAPKAKAWQKLVR